MHYFPRERFWVAVLAPAVWILFLTAPLAPLEVSADPADKITSLEDLRAARAKLAAQPRRLIANNDGCDALYFPKDREPTPRNFLDRRTSHLAGSQVKAISYCTISSGFGFFTHNTRTGEVLTRQSEDYHIGPPDTRNITSDLIRQGTDTLRAVTGFAHSHGMESFWSMRMNDTHDVAHRPDRPYFLYPQLKVDHPEWLVGNPDERTPFGRWSSVDYARPEIRELAFRHLEDVCLHYDVDGVELDFFRHLCYFKSVAEGGQASLDEVEAMTVLMRRIRTMTEEIGLQRGRPILVAMRLPDSTAFSLESGLDLETWLKEGLMDILVTTDYFRLNPWSYSVTLGHEHGVKVYPALTDPRVRGETRFKRAGVPAYRARAANAWAAGADGLYLFNLYDLDPESPLWHELGDPKSLAFTDKEYFLTDLDGKSTRWLAEGDRHQTIPMVTPTAPAFLEVNQTLAFPLMVADDLSAAAEVGHEATATLHLEFPGLEDAGRVSASLNGETLPTGKPRDGWIDWPLSAAQVRKGVNHLALTLHPPAPTQQKAWSFVYDGKELPAKPWRRDKGSSRIHESIEKNALLLADRGREVGDYCYYRAAWGADPDTESVVEARVKVIRGSSFLILTNGISGERVELSPEGIRLFHHPKLRYAMDTTGGFHRYQVTLNGADLQVHVDEVLRIDAPGVLAPRDYYQRNEVAFGAADSTKQGEALWEDVKVRTARTAQPLHDVVLSIGYKANTEE